VPAGEIAPLRLRREAAVTNQPRAPPWEPEKHRGPCAERAELSVHSERCGSSPPTEALSVSLSRPYLPDICPTAASHTKNRGRPYVSEAKSGPYVVLRHEIGPYFQGSADSRWLSVPRALPWAGMLRPLWGKIPKKRKCKSSGTVFHAPGSAASRAIYGFERCLGFSSFFGVAVGRSVTRSRAAASARKRCSSSSCGLFFAID
jgi:hypothetical protein